MNEKLNAVKCLVALFQNTTKEITNEEVEFIGRTAHDLSLNENEAKEIASSFNEKLNYKELLSQVKEPWLKKLLFRRIIAAVLLDGNVAQSERDFLTQTGEIFGWSNDFVNEYVKWMQEGIVWEKKGEELFNKFSIK